MQSLHALPPRTEKVVCFVPRWLPPELDPSGMPYKVFPLLSSLARHGFDVDLFTELHDGRDSPRMRDALRGCAGAVAWCPELNPGVQIPGLLAFLRVARETSPGSPTVAGGGFFYLLGDRMRDLRRLADQIVTDTGVPSVARFLRSRLPGPVPPIDMDTAGRDTLDPYSLYELDLSPFIRSEAMIFGNDHATLQVPTGFGCAKHCTFCFYEKTRVKLLDAKRIVALLAMLRERYGVRQVQFGELDFFTSRGRAVEIARGIIEHRLDMRWFALVFIGDVDRFSDEELDTIAESGCHTLELGTEVGSKEALERLGKHFRIDRVVPNTKRLLDRGIVPIHNMMFGFVGETPEDRRATLRLVRELRALSPRVKFFFRHYQAVPNTTMGDEALRLLPAFPDTIEALASYRMEMEGGRSMPWLPSREEKDIKLLTEYLLPLAYDDYKLQGTPSLTRRALRRLADLRCKFSFFQCPLDRALFEKMERVGLSGTFLP